MEEQVERVTGISGALVKAQDLQRPGDWRRATWAYSPRRFNLLTSNNPK